MTNYVLYDGDCRVCSRWVPAWKRTLHRAGFEIAPRHDLTDFTILFGDGRRILGADAYRCVMRRIWWAYPVFLLSLVPGLRSAFNAGYRTFASHRHRWRK